MDVEKGGCLLNPLAVGVCAAVLILASCAQRGPAADSARAVTTRPTPATSTAEAPVRKQPSAATEKKTKLSMIVPRREPTKVEQIISLVREGHLVHQVRGALVFSKGGPSSLPGTGLYEDAILLGRLRNALKETEAIPDSLSATATVRDAKAFLIIQDSLPASEAAKAIDAALRTPGVNSVQVRISG